MISSINSSSSLMAALMAKLSQSSQTSGSTSATKAVFAKVDANGDGKVSADELKVLSSSSDSSKIAKIISDNDKDGDNALSEEELAGFLNQLTSGGMSGGTRMDLMSLTDANDDGSVTFEEFNAQKPDDVTDAQSQQLFASIDSDGDGSLSSDEVSAFEANRPQGGPQGAMMGPPPPPPSDDDDYDDDTTVSSLLTKLLDTLTASNDTDETDSSGTTSETADAQQKLFNFFDQDSDGTVSETELNDGISALKTAMASYMLSVQETRAAA